MNLRASESEWSVYGGSAISAIQIVVTFWRYPEAERRLMNVQIDGDWVEEGTACRIVFEEVAEIVATGG